MTGGMSRAGRAVAGWVASLADIIVLVIAYGVTFLPQPVDGWIVGVTLGLNSRRRRDQIDALAAAMQRALGDPPENDWSEVATEHERIRIETKWQRVRAIHRKTPKVVLSFDGLEHLNAALEAGHGAVLWRMLFCSSHLPKQALWQAGHPMVHLSNWYHGSRHRNYPGLRVFAPLYIKAETRFLAARIVIPRDGSLGYLQVLLGHLEANQVLSIFGEHEGRASVATTILGKEFHLATGAPALARRADAPLLASYIYREGRDR